jgi:hypothetical protein
MPPRLSLTGLKGASFRIALFKECQKKVDDWYPQELNKLDEKDYSWKYGMHQLMARSNLNSQYIPQEEKAKLSRRADELTPESLKQDDIRIIKGRIPEQTDKACREVAEQMLSVLQQAVTYSDWPSF